MGNNRISTIDIAKGIGIILVVFGHFDHYGTASRNLIYSFHMPLFFLLSGIFFTQCDSFKALFKKTFRTLFVPFLICCCFDAAIEFTQSILEGSFNSIQFLKSTLLTITGIDFRSINTPVWFLFVLLFVRLICYFISKNRIVEICSIVFGVIYIFVLSHFEIPIKCLYLVIPPAMVFFLLGKILSQQIIHFDETIKQRKIVWSFLFIVSIPALYYLSNTNQPVSMLDCSYGNVVLFLISAILGIYITLYISSIISCTKITVIMKPLIYFGSNSLYIMIWHYYFSRVAFPTILNKLGLSSYLYSYIAIITGVIITLLLSIPVIYICNNYLYVFFGKKK